MMRYRAAWVVVFAVGVLAELRAVEARPIEIRASGVLEMETYGMDSLRLDGAEIQMAYYSDTEATALDVGSVSGVSRRRLEGTMVVTITGRPDGAPDLIDLTVTGEPVIAAYNRFPPNPNPDTFEIPGAIFTIPDEMSPLVLGPWGFDLGSQEFLPGTAPPVDLDFVLGDQQGWSLLPGMPAVNDFMWLDYYPVCDFTYSITPEPGMLSLLGVASWVSLMRRRRRAL